MTTQPFKLGQKTRKGQFCKAQTESGRCLLSSMNLPMWQVHSGGRSSSTKERADSASDPHLALLDNSMHLGHVNDGTSTDMDGPRSRGTDHSAPAALKSTSGRANRPLNLCRWWDCLQQYDFQLQVPPGKDDIEADWLFPPRCFSQMMMYWFTWFTHPWMTVPLHNYPN